MRRPSCLILTAAMSLLVFAPAADAMIQVDKGIAGARLDNSMSEVRAALGKPSKVTRGTTIFGPFTEYRFRGGVRVNFQGNRGATLVETTGLGDRTRKGVGVGSTEQAVKDGVANITCQTTAGTRICQNKEGLAGQRLTSFFIAGGKVTRVSIGIVID
jgi:hypothetical protein